jgi:hypothetical protein
MSLVNRYDRVGCGRLLWFAGLTLVLAISLPSGEAHARKRAARQVPLSYKFERRLSPRGAFINREAMVYVYGGTPPYLVKLKLEDLESGKVDEFKYEKVVPQYGREWGLAGVSDEVAAPYGRKKVKYYLDVGDSKEVMGEVGELELAATMLSGKWTFVCCKGQYQFEVRIEQTGNNFDCWFNDGTTGRGTVFGAQVQFARFTGTKHIQDYTLALSADGKTMTGAFSGYGSQLNLDRQVTMTRN